MVPAAVATCPTVPYHQAEGGLPAARSPECPSWWPVYSYCPCCQLTPVVPLLCCPLGIRLTVPRAMSTARAANALPPVTSSVSLRPALAIGSRGGAAPTRRRRTEPNDRHYDTRENTTRTSGGFKKKKKRNTHAGKYTGSGADPTRARAHAAAARVRVRARGVRRASPRRAR